MITNGFVTLFCSTEPCGEFKRAGVFPAWIRRKQRLRNTAEGIFLCDTFDVRIENQHLKSVAVGDLIYFGELEESEFRPEKCRKVAAATENTFGTVPHWHLEAEVQYK